VGALSVIKSKGRQPKPTSGKGKSFFDEGDPGVTRKREPLRMIYALCPLACTRCLHSTTPTAQKEDILGHLAIRAVGMCMNRLNSGVVYGTYIERKELDETW